MLNFIKGILIGIGKIIPGVSGSLIAISFGIYERLLNDLSKLFKLNKKEYKFLIEIGLGISLSIIMFSKLILYILKKHYFFTMFLFLGFIIGGITPIFNKMKTKTNFKLIIIFILPIFILYILSILDIKLNLSLNYKNIFFIGILESITMILPGLSGTAILMSLGIYEDLLLLISSFQNIGLMILFIFGICVGILGLSKILSYFMINKEYEFYYLIFSFTLISILVIINKTLYFTYTFKMLLFGLLLLLLGYYISKKLWYNKNRWYYG